MRREALVNWQSGVGSRAMLQGTCSCGQPCGLASSSQFAWGGVSHHAQSIEIPRSRKIEYSSHEKRPLRPSRRESSPDPSSRGS